MIDIINGDCRSVLATLPDTSVHCVVTSPPYYGLRDYGVDGQIGLEASPDSFVSEMVSVFREVRRVLRDDGTLWLNLGDSYVAQRRNKPTNDRDDYEGKNKASRRNGGRFPGMANKNMLGIPWRVAFALQADGWILRQDIIWHKPNPIPENVQDRCTKAHEYIFLFAKSQRYFYDADAIKEPKSENTHARRAKNGSVKVTQKTEGATFNVKNNSSFSQGISGEVLDFRNKRSVWSVLPRSFKDAHFATFPPDLIEPCILAGCPEGGTVLDPFFGAGTTGLVASRHNRRAIGIELNPDYVAIAKRRLGIIEQDIFA